MASPALRKETTAELARRVFSELQTSLFSFETAAKEGDVEAIHAMRVTTRRLRVAQSNFAVCLPVELRRLIKGHLTQLADALGRVRDIDVMLESLITLEEEIPIARKTMIADLRARLLRRRRYHLSRMSAYFKSESYQGLKEVLPEMLKSYGETA